MTGPIVFSDETASHQLVEHGEVVTFRTSDRTTGRTWYRHSRTGPKQGDVYVSKIDAVDVDRNELEQWSDLSGFESVDHWIDAIGSLNDEVDSGFVYRVLLDPPEIEPTDVDEHFRAKNALRILLENPHDRAVRIESNPEPMYATLEAGELAFWCFDYSKKCQVRENVEDCYGPFETVVDQVHAYVEDGYPIGTVARDRIDDEPKPKATSLDDFDQGGEA